MDQYESYHVLPYQEEKQDDNLIVSEGGMELKALIRELQE